MKPNYPRKLILLLACCMVGYGCNCKSDEPSTFGLSGLYLLDNAETRSITAENPTGEKGKGGMAHPDSTADNKATNARSADLLGQGWKVQPFLAVDAGQTATIMDVKGPGIIQHIWMVEGLSRKHILRFYWDDETEPSIEVPAPDFFAVGHELFAPVNSEVVVVNPANSLNCFWPMPFRKSARVTFTNEDDKDLRLLGYQITYALTEVPKNAGYFHAQWRKGSTRDQNPFVILDGVKGKGRYVGTFMAYTQMTDNNWWGEGEVKMYIDGDKDFPTICGTGTEDYFLGTYGFPRPYSGLYAGSTLSDKENDPTPNYWSLYRWHTRDPISFREDLKVTVQALGWNREPRNTYRQLEDDIASVAFWYQTEPHQPFPPLPAIADRARIVEIPEK